MLRLFVRMVSTSIFCLPLYQRMYSWSYVYDFRQSPGLCSFISWIHTMIIQRDISSDLFSHLSVKVSHDHVIMRRLVIREWLDIFIELVGLLIAIDRFWHIQLNYLQLVYFIHVTEAARSLTLKNLTRFFSRHLWMKNNSVFLCTALRLASSVKCMSVLKHILLHTKSTNLAESHNIPFDMRQNYMRNDRLVSFSRYV